MAKEPVATRRRPSWILAVLGAFLVVRGALQLEQLGANFPTVKLFGGIVALALAAWSFWDTYGPRRNR